MQSKYLLLFLSLASAAILGGALVGQYGFGLYPCELCIYQRWPHGMVIALGLLGTFAVASERLRRAILLACCFALLVGAGIAIYHSGVELGWFEGPDACTAKAGGEMTIEQIRAQIAGAPLVSCNQAMAYIFGLSMAVWNALISVYLVGTVVVFSPIGRHKNELIKNEKDGYRWLSIIFYIAFSPFIVLLIACAALICITFIPIIMIYTFWYGKGSHYTARLRNNCKKFFGFILEVLANAPIP